MTLLELNEKITGEQNPKFTTEREKCLINICLGIINNLEEEIRLEKKNSEQSDNLSISFANYFHEEKKKGVKAMDWQLLRFWKEKREPK